VNILDKRWAQLADELKLHQLDNARSQAERWRTGLAGLTALLGVVTIVKGPDELTALSGSSRRLVVTLIGLAFAALLAGSLVAVRAASGAPRLAWLTGPALKAWTQREVVTIRRSVLLSAALLVVGLLLMATALGQIWLAQPATAATRPTVEIVTTDNHLCGELLGMTQTQVTVDLDAGPAVKPFTVPTDRLVSVTPTRCPEN
jgi:hypothetical protein